MATDTKLNIEYVSIDSIQPYEKNARTHGKADVKSIAESIREFGFKDPIGIWHDTIVEGHGRLLAAKELGMEKVPIIRLDDLTDEQRKAYALAHNKTAELSSWDQELLEEQLKQLSEIDMSLFGFDMSALGFEEGEAQDDGFVAVPPTQAQSGLGDIFKLGGHYVMCGDSTDPETIAKLMQGQQADLLVTDPPYNVDYTGKTKDALKIENDKKDDAQFREFLVNAIKAADSVMKEGAAFYIWHADSEGYNFRGACRDNGWKVRQCLIWRKNTFVLGRQDYQWAHEPAIYGWKDGAAHYFVNDRTQSTVIEKDKLNIDKMKKEEMRDLLKQLLDDQIPTTVIEEDKPSRSAEHPTMKPIPLIGRLIKNSSRPGEIVLDTFGGSGTTLMACEQLNRKCYTCELDPRYVDVIIERWEKYTGLKAEKIND